MPAVSALPASTRPSGARSTESSRPAAGLAILLALLGLGAMATALLGPLALAASGPAATSTPTGGSPQTPLAAPAPPASGSPATSSTPALK